MSGFHPAWDLSTIPDPDLFREYATRMAARRTEEQKRQGGRPDGAKDKQPRKRRASEGCSYVVWCQNRPRDKWYQFYKWFTTKGDALAWIVKNQAVNSIAANAKYKVKRIHPDKPLTDGSPLADKIAANQMSEE